MHTPYCTEHMRFHAADFGLVCTNSCTTSRQHHLRFYQQSHFWEARLSLCLSIIYLSTIEFDAFFMLHLTTYTEPACAHYCTVPRAQLVPCPGLNVQSTNQIHKHVTAILQANVRQTNVEAFGIRLSSGLAAIPDRISATPQGQIIPPALGGPAYLWNITSMGQQLFIFSVNTSGLSASTGPGSDVRLSDICAQGIAVADNQGTPIWEQPSMNGSCV